MSDQETAASDLYVDAVNYANEQIERGNNLLITQACCRFLDILKSPDIWIDHKTLTKFKLFASYIKHFKGEYAGKSFDILPFQAFIITNTYGIRRVIDGVKTHIYQYKNVYIEIPKKNGKSFLMSCMALFDCLLAEPSGVEVYCTATTRAQAKLVWDSCNTFVQMNKQLGSLFKSVASRNIIYSKASKRTSYVKALSADADRLDGINIFTCCMDEIKDWKGRRFYDLLMNSFAGRENYHCLAITTAGYNKETVCWEIHEQLKAILEGRLKKDDLFGIIYTVTDPDKWDDIEQWKTANPMLGYGKSMSFMKDAFEQSKQIPSFAVDFKNKQLNIWTQESELWLDNQDIARCTATVDREALKGEECFVGIDLARVSDLSAVAYFFPARNEFFVDFFAPQEDLVKREHDELAPYQTWVEQGHMTVTPGNTTDFEFILHSMLERAKDYNIVKVGYDRYFAGELINNLQKEGFDLQSVGMGYVSMTDPCHEFERQIVANEVKIDANPVLQWCLSNVCIRRDPNGNIKPDKSDRRHKIDGVVAYIIALGVYRQTLDSKDLIFDVLEVFK